MSVSDKPSKTQQQYKEQCDVNNILAKYQKTGQVTHIAKTKGNYIDLTGVQSYQESMNTIIKAQNAFMQLPATVRKELGNDPQQLITLLSDEKQKEKAEKLGLLNLVKQVDKMDTLIDEVKKLKPETKKQNDEK